MDAMLYFMKALMIHPIQTNLLCLLIIISLGGFLLAIKRLFFHPLSNFPGPRLAAITPFYKTYYEVVKGGELLHKILDLHTIHGSVIRIGPNELHFNDYRAYSDIYSVGSRFTKDPTFYGCFGASNSAFGAIDPNDSKARRGAMHSFFSRRAVLRLESLIQEKVELLVYKLANRGSVPTNMFLAFRSATLDIITEYMFGHCLDALDHPDFSSPLLTDIQEALPLLWLIKSFPWMLPVLATLPSWLNWQLYDQFQAFLGIRTFIVTWLDRTAQETEQTRDSGNFTICHRLLDPFTNASHTIMPPTQAFIDEALSLLQAGSDTVGNTCTVGTFFILNDKVVHSRLVEELQSIWPDQDDFVDLHALQSLPYLTAVIKESLRLSHGFVTPLPRVVGPLGAKIAGYQIPPNVVVGMSVTTVHLNPTLFENPTAFVPERWLECPSILDRYLVSFSKGPRMCLGIRMAWIELYLFFGYVFRKLSMEVVDTSIDDFRDFKDYFVPIYQGRQLHVRATQAK